tara:strand:+ start:401 stop:1555 length:1155 start_codon:yes stop_codon:yes gene_type:complete
MNKIFRNILDKIKPNFEKGGKLEKLYPAYDAFETFLFVPNHVTKSGVHVRDGMDLKRTMVVVILAMIPVLLFGMYNIGFQHFSQLTGSGDNSFFEIFFFGFKKVIPLIIVSYVVGLTVEFAFAVFRGHQVNEGYLVTGMLIPLVMPVDLPLWMLAISVVFAVVIGKEVFGGTGMNILNPALLSRAFLFFAYPTYMSGDKVWVAEAMNNDAISGETILGSLAAKTEFTYSISDMFLGFIPGSIGETSLVAILIGALVLLFSGIGSWRIMLSALIGGALMGMIFNIFSYNPLMSFPWQHHLIVGGFAFGVVFMATDPVSAAQTNMGKYIYGFLIGFLAIMIRVFNPAYPEGIMLAILFMNVMAPLIDHYVIKRNINSRLKRLKDES